MADKTKLLEVILEDNILTKFVLEQEDHTIVQVDVPSGGAELASNLAMAKWSRAGAWDEDYGGINWIDDQTELDPTENIVVDDSVGWVTNFGYAMPKVTEAGLYAISAAHIQSGGVDPGDWIKLSIGLFIYDAVGDDIPFYPRKAIANQVYPVGAGAPFWANLEIIVQLPADAHIEIDTDEPQGLHSGGAIPEVNGTLELLIRKLL